MKTSCRSYLGIVFLIIARMAESQPVVIYAEDSFRRNQDATFRWNAISPSDLRSALPLISSICEKLSLSVPTPVITNQVARVRGVLFDSEGNRSLYVTLTNGFEFWVEHGTVIGFRSSKDVEGMGDTRLFHLAFGPVNLNRNQAIGKARYALRRLGYDLHEIYVDQEPAKVRDPFRWGTNTISIYRVEWNDPLQQNSPAVKIVLSGSDGTICSMEVFSPVFWRRNAAQSVLNSTEKPGDRPWSNVTARMLETGTQFAREFDLPIPLPLALSNVVLIEVSDDTNVKFRTGWWFKYHQERLAGFTAPDSCFGNYGGPYFYSERLPIDRYIGKWNISTNEAISLAQHSITNAGLHFQSLEFGSAFAVLTPSPVNTYVIPRYYIAWETSPPDDNHFELWRADVEVDGDTKAIKHLYVRDHRVPTVGAPTSRK